MPKTRVAQRVDRSLEIRTLFSILIGRAPSVLSIILVGHLLVEHLLGQIILYKKVGKMESLKKLTFSQKLETLYPTWIPLSVYWNIKILNGIRNDLAHNLGHSNYEPIVYGPRREKIYIKTPRGKNHSKYYPRELVEHTLCELANYSSDVLGLAEIVDTMRLFRFKR